MSNDGKYHYEAGAIHYDHHKEITINGNVTEGGLREVMHGFFGEAEEAEYEEIDCRPDTIADHTGKVADTPETPINNNGSNKISACFEQGLLTVGKPYNQLFCLMAAMMARRLLTDTTVPGFVRMVAASCPALLQNGITVENYVGAINDLTQKSFRYSFSNYITDQATMVEFIRSCYPKTSKGKERAVSQQMVAKANEIFLFLK